MNRTLLPVLILATIFWGACRTKTQVTNPPPPPPEPIVVVPVDTVKTPPPVPQPKPFKSLREEKDLFVEIARGGCKGRCPIYKIQVFRDGRVLYHGIEFVEKKGWYSGKITAEQVETIRAKARSAGYLQLANKYPEKGAVIVDFPTCVTFIRLDGQEKEVQNRHHAPKALAEFEQFLDDMFVDHPWVPTLAPGEQ